MKRTLEVLNDLKREGIFSRYAIGGAMGAIFYAEPFLTFDLDVCFTLPNTAGETPVGHTAGTAVLRHALRPRGCTEENECVLIEGVPVRFLPAYKALVEEALNQAREVMFEGVPTRVLRSEHLVAICLQTGRNKDRDRVRILREQATLDRNFLAEILRRHQLEKIWERWTE